MMASNYYKAANILPKETIALVMNQLSESVPEWEGGVIYFPSSFNGMKGFMSTREIAYQKALGVTAVLDGFSKAEAAVMSDVSEKTINRWMETYGDKIATALRSVREGEEDG